MNIRLNQYFIELEDKNCFLENVGEKQEIIEIRVVGEEETVDNCKTRVLLSKGDKHILNTENKVFAKMNVGLTGTLNCSKLTVIKEQILANQVATSDGQNVQTHLNTFGTNISKNTGAIATHQKDIASMKKSITNKSDKSELSSVIDRVSVIEEKVPQIEANNSQIQTVLATIENLKSQIETLEQKVAALEAQPETIKESHF